MSVLVGVIVGLVVGRVLVVAGRRVLANPVLARRNFRDRDVPTAAGLFAIVAVVAIEAGRELVEAVGNGLEAQINVWQVLVVLACAGFGLVGIADDLMGDTAPRGFRGHVGALASGRLTTGMLKIIGGSAVAVVLAAAAGTVDAIDGPNVLLDAALIALAANMCNLFDRAPGRALKVGLCAWVPLVLVAGTGGAGAAVAPVVGAFAALLFDDLHERLMIGDTGAYAFGGTLGLLAVTSLAPAARAGALVVLVALTVTSEFVSFSRVIAAVPPLRWLDEAGRRPAPR